MEEAYTPPEPIVHEDGSVEYPQDEALEIIPIEEQDLTPVLVDEDDYDPEIEGDGEDG